VAAKQVAAARLEVNLPAMAENGRRNWKAQEVTVRVESNGQSIGEVKTKRQLASAHYSSSPLQDFFGRAASIASQAASGSISRSLNSPAPRSIARRQSPRIRR